MTMPPFATRVIALMFLVASAHAVAAQTVTEWNAESRTTLSFRVNEAVAQRLLPPGWTVAPSASPANRGGNLTLVFIERLLVLDPQGQPLRTGTSRYVVLAIPARNAAGEANTIVVGGLSPGGAGAYDAYLTTTVARVERTSSAQNEEAGQATEHWEFTAASGERLELRLAFRRATPVKSHAEAKLRSAARPDFTRTYRIDQATDVLRSAASADRITDLSFRASGPAFATLFDGTEQLLSVTSIPWYVREVSVP
jgi:hypothetical protein